MASRSRSTTASADGAPRRPLSEAPDVCITSVGQFVSYLETHCGGEGLVFRGQRVDMPLVPQLSRLRPRGMSRAALEQVMMKEFMRTAPPYLDIVPQSTLDWLAVARHYGMATRLLDWTFNPLTALWFVVERRPDQGDGVLWILDSSAYEQFGDNGDPFRLGDVRIVRPRHIVGRIVSQLGLFTIHPFQDDQFVPLEDIDAHRRSLKKLRIDRASYPEIRRVLDRCGVNASTIYPGLDGLCAQLQWAHTEQESMS
ncbi:MAG: hypothetical protein JWN79_3227 [Gemmatimonadetes bacterium]|jgi:hypothetical protein|nr:hypothetical protein [Gemmatimonadota bacterium]